MDAFRHSVQFLLSKVVAPHWSFGRYVMPHNVCTSQVGLDHGGCLCIVIGTMCVNDIKINC